MGARPSSLCMIQLITPTPAARRLELTSCSLSILANLLILS